MNLELFIARRLLKGRRNEVVSMSIIKIALVGIALGVCVMLLSVFIITGFKKEITTKLSGFSAHLNILPYEDSDSFTGEKIVADDTLMADIRKIPGIKQAYKYISRPVILKNKHEIHGIVLKGVDSTYSGDFYKKHLKQGEFPDYHSSGTSDEILISASVAGMLNVNVGEKVIAHFVQEPPRVRMFQVKGIYDTGFKEYDDAFALCDIRQLRRLNDWQEEQVSGIAVELEDMNEIADKEMAVYHRLPRQKSFYRVVTLQDTAPQIFDWLNLLNMNVWIILILIVVVAGFNMVSGLFILILDKTSFIGVLKALGYKNTNLKKLFLYIAAGLIGRGMLAGNAMALLLGGLQYYFHFIRLDPDVYYMDTVPVNFDIGYILLLNAGVWVVSVLMLIVPTILISRIKPIKAIRFE